MNLVTGLHYGYSIPNCMINRISIICKIRYLWHSPCKPALGLIWFIKHHDRPQKEKKHHHSVHELSSMPCQDSNRRRQTYSASQCCACSFWGPIPFAFHSQIFLGRLIGTVCNVVSKGRELKKSKSISLRESLHSWRISRTAHAWWVQGICIGMGDISYRHGRFSVNIFAHHHIGVHVCVNVQIYVYKYVYI